MLLLIFLAAVSIIPFVFSTKLVVTRTRPTSNTTGNIFTIIPVRDGVVGSRSQQFSLESYSSSVDDKIVELRNAGQSSPTGLTYLQIGLSNPDVIQMKSYIRLFLTLVQHLMLWICLQWSNLRCIWEANVNFDGAEGKSKSIRIQVTVISLFNVFVFKLR